MSVGKRGRSTRLVATALALIAAASVTAACGSGGSDDASTTSSSRSGGSHAGQSIAIVMPESVPGYAKQIGCGAFEEGERLGFDVGQPQGPVRSQDAGQQAQIIQAQLARKPDGLIFSAVDPKAGGIAIKPAVSQGMPVVAVDVRLEDPSLAVSYISSSHEDGGKLGGELLARQIGEEGKVAVLSMLPTNPITIARIRGFEEAMEQFPGIDVVATEYTDVDVNKSAAAASALLSKHPDLKAIYTSNDLAATGAATALRQSQKIGDVKLITWDLQPAGIKLLQEGSATGSVVQRPREQGRIAVQQLANELDGRPVERAIVAPVTTVTSEQINDPDTRELYYSNAC